MVLSLSWWALAVGSLLCIAAVAGALVMGRSSRLLLGAMVCGAALTLGVSVYERDIVRGVGVCLVCAAFAIRHAQAAPRRSPSRPRTGTVLEDFLARKHTRAYVKGLVMLLILAGIGVVFNAMDLRGSMDEHWIDAHVRGHGLAGYALFIGAASLFTAVGLPRQMVSFLGGYAFGSVVGTLLGTAGTTVGCALAFFYARFFGRSYVSRRFGKKIGRVDRFLSHNTVSTTLVIRFMPVGSNLLTNLLAGVTSVGAVPYIVGSALGFIPQNLVFALLGSGFNVDRQWQVALSVVLFVISTWIGIRLYRTQRAGRVMEDATDEEADSEA